MKKTITRIFAVAALFVAIGVSANAQNGRFSIGAELSLPMGDFGDGASMGFGGSLGYEHPIGDAMGLGLRAGYLMFGGKDEGPDWKMIPAQAFFKYYFGEAQDGFYAMANLGIHNSSVKTEDITWINPITGNEEVLYEGETVSDTKLSYAPEIGYHLANIDLGLRYQMIATEGSTTSYLGFRLAYVFGEK